MPKDLTSRFPLDIPGMLACTVFSQYPGVRAIIEAIQPPFTKGASPSFLTPCSSDKAGHLFATQAVHLIKMPDPLNSEGAKSFGSCSGGARSIGSGSGAAASRDWRLSFTSCGLLHDLHLTL